MPSWFNPSSQSVINNLWFLSLYVCMCADDLAWLGWRALFQSPQELPRCIAKWRLREIDDRGNAHNQGNSGPHKLLGTHGCIQNRFLHAVVLLKWEGAIQGRVWTPDKTCGVHDFKEVGKLWEFCVMESIHQMLFETLRPNTGGLYYIRNCIFLEETQTHLLEFRVNL